MKRHRVKLSEAERTQLERFTRQGSAKAPELTRARILLSADEGGAALKDEQISQALGVTVQTIERVRKHYCQAGLERAVHRQARPDILDVYARAYDPKRPVVGLDEKPCRLIKDVLQPVRAKPGRVQRIDYEYERCGSANLFGWVEPLTGKRDVWVTERRTKQEYAQALERLVEAYPEAEMILVVQDNLNTHTKAALYEAFEPTGAHYLANKLEFHFTPRHGSWLNVQELETRGRALSSSGRRSLGRRSRRGWDVGNACSVSCTLGLRSVGRTLSRSTGTSRRGCAGEAQAALPNHD